MDQNESKMKSKMPKLIPPTMIWGLAQDILFTLSGVFCIAVPGRILELFEETLQGGSDMSLRAAGVQYRSTEQRIKSWLSKRLVLLITGVCVCVRVCFSIIHVFLWCLNGRRWTVCQLCSTSFVQQQMPIAYPDLFIFLLFHWRRILQPSLLDNKRKKQHSS